MADVTEPFWKTYTPLSRFCWTTLALVPMWVMATALLAICAIFLALIAVVYPIVHYLWGMRSQSNGS